jgi:hypothetical protein
VLEDSDADRLYFAKGLPREWVASGDEIKIEGAPTRWGRVTLNMKADRTKQNVQANVQLAQAGSPQEVQLKFRLPKKNALRAVTVNGEKANFGGPHGDTVIFATKKEKNFDVVAQFA